MDLKFCQSIGHVYKTVLINMSNLSDILHVREALLRLASPSVAVSFAGKYAWLS